MERNRKRPIETPRDQQNCGGCWAFSTVTVLGDRFSLANQIQSPVPSTAWLISENYNIPNVGQNGCNGGLTYNAAKWLETKYNKLEKCWPFTLLTKANVPNPDNNQEILGPNPLESDNLNNCCFNCCDDKIKDIYDVKISCNPGPDSSNPYTKYFGANVDQIKDGKYTLEQINRIIDEIKTDIMYYGPVCASFFVTTDFMNYWGSIKRNPSLTDFSKNDPDVPVYKPNPLNENDILGGHAVVITGWGIAKDGTKYWEVRNSWGQNTGDGGYCKFAISTMTTSPLNNLYGTEIDTGNSHWRGLDIPLIVDGNYFGGVVSFIPNDIPNLQDLINKGIFKKSSAGNLLPTGDKPAPPAPGPNPGPYPGPNPPSPSGDSEKSSNTLLYILIIMAVLILLGILIYFSTKH